MREDKTNRHGQGLVEYALLILFIAVVTIAVLSQTGQGMRNVLSKVMDGFSSNSSRASLAETLSKDFLLRMQDYYNRNGHWPRSWGDYRFTDLGLNPDDWSGPVDGIYWNPNGARLGLANRAGDNLQVYVNDANGNTLHLYDGWNIWCQASDGKCYYHTVAPGNEVDIRTLVVVER